mgnify:CR=1 FL=1
MLTWTVGKVILVGFITFRETIVIGVATDVTFCKRIFCHVLTLTGKITLKYHISIFVKTRAWPLKHDKSEKLKLNLGTGLK